MDRVIQSDKLTNRLTYIWVMLSVYSGISILGYWFPALGALTLRCMMLSVVSVTAITACSMQWKGHGRDRSVNIVVVMLLVWMAVMYFGSGLQCLWWVHYITQYEFISYLWVWVLLLPEVSLLRSFLRSLEAISYVGIVLVMISLLRYTHNSYMQFLCEGFVLGAGLVVMTQKLHSKQLNTLCYVILVLGFLTATIHARRNLMLTSGCYLAVAASQLMFGSIIKSSGTRILVVMTCIFTLLCCAGFYLLNDHGMFARITGRFGDNTRDYVFLHFAADFGTHPVDLVAGRSMLGTYECPGVEGEGDNGGQRGVVECGYLNNILKGGIIFLALYLYLMIASMRRGFKANNVLGKACAWILVFQLIDMVYFGILSFNLKAFMLWMVVSIGLNRELMDKSDEEVKRLIYRPQTVLPKWKEA